MANELTVFFEDLYNQDILAKKVKVVEEEETGQPEEGGHAEEGGLEDENVGLDNVGNEKAGPSGSAWEKKLEQATVDRLKGMEDMVVFGFNIMDGRIDGLEERIDVLEVRLNDIEVRHIGAALDGDLPGVIYATYHDDPTNVYKEGDYIDLLAKVATEGIEEDDA